MRESVYLQSSLYFLSPWVLQLDGGFSSFWYSCIKHLLDPTPEELGFQQERIADRTSAPCRHDVPCALTPL